MHSFFTFFRYHSSKLFLWGGFFWLLGCYFWQTDQLPLWDYDAGRNYQILQKLTRGDFQDFFHHLSPLFYLLFLPFFQVSSQPFFLLCISILCSLLVFCVGYRAFACQHSGWWVLGWASSFFMVHVGRYFSIEAPGLLCWMLWLYCYFQEKGKPWQRDLLLAAMILINYKAVLLIGIGAVWALILGIFSFKRLLQAALTIGLCIGILMFFGMLQGLPWYRYPAGFWGLLENPTLQGSQNNQFEWQYYFEYFIYFENPLLIGSLLALLYLFFKKQIPHFSLKEKYILLTAASYFAVMCLLPKAPRGLLFCYPVFYWAAFRVWQQCFSTRPWLLYSLVLASISLQTLRLHQHLYFAAPNPYPEVAAYLKEKNIAALATTASFALLPYLDDTTQMYPLLKPEAMGKLQAKGIAYLLIDDAYQVAALPSFDTLAQLPALRTWPASHWGRTMLHLEHSEFTGKSFQASLEAARRLARKPPLLRLVVLPKANGAAHKSVE